MSEDSRVRQNYWADIVAAIACFVLEAVWYSVFYQSWLNGIGRTQEWAGSTKSLFPFQCATALAAGLVMAAAISCVTQLTGPQTMYRGMRVATALWMGFVITVWATEYVFEVRPWSLLFINAGFWFLGMNIMGAIVGGWKAKAPVGVTQPSSATVKA
jgi:hypothetical protein